MNREEKQIIQSISFEQMKQSHKKKNFFCYYFHMEYCRKNLEKRKFLQFIMCVCVLGLYIYKEVHFYTEQWGSICEILVRYISFFKCEENKIKRSQDKNEQII